MTKHEDRFSYKTKLWKRSKNSYASTIPREILAIKNAPVGKNAIVEWSINEETGTVEVRFETTEDEDGDAES